MMAARPPAVRAAATAPLGRSKYSKLPLCFTLHDAETQSRVQDRQPAFGEPRVRNSLVLQF